MERILRFLRSNVGRKVMMALTGLFLVGFLITHLLGNLLALKSAEEFNMYSHALTSSWLIYLAEGGLLVLFLYHALNGIYLVRKNRRARGKVGYEKKDWAGGTSNKSFASSTMIVTGVLLFLFVVFHVVTMKFGFDFQTMSFPATKTVTYSGETVRDLHTEVLHKFSLPALAFGYVVMMGLVAFHLWHGVGSALESLGLRSRKKVRFVTQTLAAALAVGFAIIPLVIYVQQS